MSRWFSNPPCQVTELTFSDEKEMKSWCEAKWGAWQSDLHPARYHDTNWRLDELWYVHDKGEHKDRETTMEEKIERAAKDGQSAQAAISYEEKKCGKTAAERHKHALTKFSFMMNKLNKTLSQAEVAMPGLKRKLKVTEFSGMKDGVAKCRAMKDKVMDEMEDLREPKEGDHEDFADRLDVLQKDVQEHQEALLEALTKFKGAPQAKQERCDEGEHPKCAPGSFFLILITPTMYPTTHAKFWCLKWFSVFWFCFLGCPPSLKRSSHLEFDIYGHALSNQLLKFSASQLETQTKIEGWARGVICPPCQELVPQKVLKVELWRPLVLQNSLAHILGIWRLTIGLAKL